VHFSQQLNACMCAEKQQNNETIACHQAVQAKRAICLIGERKEEGEPVILQDGAEPVIRSRCTLNERVIRP